MTKIYSANYVHLLAPEALNDGTAALAYERMAHRPRAFGVELSYLHFKHETVAQYLNILHALDVKPVWDDGSHEYHNSSEMFTDASYGAIVVRHTHDSGDWRDMPPDHPMLEPVAPYLTGHTQTFGPDMASLALNDIFRFVHDIYGHWGGRDAKHHTFGPNGERAAWQRHRNYYSRAALQALWCETRGQAAWVNAYDNHADLPMRDRPFAQQKSGVVASWLV